MPPSSPAPIDRGRTALRGLLGLVLVLVLLTAGVATARAVAETDPVATSAAQSGRVYCTKKRKPKGCVKVPKAAKRPNGVNAQGGPAITPAGAVNGGGLGAGPGQHRATALAWAQEQKGARIWSWRCERFVEEAYGTRFRHRTAIAAAKALGIQNGSIRSAPKGALVFFRADKANRGYGHVGLSLGNGRMISALDTVRVTNVAKSRYWRGLYLGWTDAPADWPGRIPPPPGVVTDFDANAMVRITAPAANSRISGGAVPLMASAAGVGGVAFDAYYASDPKTPGTRAWHPLGNATQENGSWVLHLDSTTIPDQGASTWGTVNIAAIALDRQGRRSGVRDFRRLDVLNTAPEREGTLTSTTTTQEAPPPPPFTYPEYAGGAANTWTDYRSAGGEQGPGIAGGQRIEVACRIEGYQVPDGNTWWYRIAQAPWSHRFYVSADAFYNNGATSGSLHGTPFYDEKVPICT